MERNQLLITKEEFVWKKDIYRMQWMNTPADGFIPTEKYEDVIKLREEGYNGGILLFFEVLDVKKIIQLLHLGVIFSVGSVMQADMLKEAQYYCGILPRVHLKVDIQNENNGFSPESLSLIKYYMRGLQMEGCYARLRTSAWFPAISLKRQYRYLMKVNGILSGNGFPIPPFTVESVEKREILGKIALTKMGHSDMINYI